MRVTSTSTYRNFTTSVNSVHAALNKSMNKITTGAAYENAAEAPLAYYEGQKIDSKYLDALSKSNGIKDVSNRIYQQELGARTIQDVLSNETGAKNQVRFARTDTTSDTALQTTMEALLQDEQKIVDALNTQYEDYFIYGGNDYTTPPFSLSGDGTELTFQHKFPGDTTASKVVFKLQPNADGAYTFQIDETQTSSPANSATPPANPQVTAKDILHRVMKEQDRMDLGYGTITRRNTLIDTFSGGLNMMTGITSDVAKAQTDTDKFMTMFQTAFDKSALTLTGQAVQTIKAQLDGKIDRGVMHEKLGDTLENMTKAEPTLSSIYGDLGNKYSVLEDTQTKLKAAQQDFQEQYADKLGADPYESVLEMYNTRSSYNAALKVGSQLMSSSLFDFVR